MAPTLHAGRLIVASAYPDPPFEVMDGPTATGFDIELMRAICARLGVALQPVRYSGDDFNGIFDGLAKGTYDAVISGTTITPPSSPGGGVRAAPSASGRGRGNRSVPARAP